jgi:hypothetical protein
LSLFFFALFLLSLYEGSSTTSGEPGAFRPLASTIGWNTAFGTSAHPRLFDKKYHLIFD